MDNYWQYIEIGALATLVVLLFLGYRWCYAKLLQQSQKTKNIWDDAILSAFDKPSKVALIVLYLFVLMNYFSFQPLADIFHKFLLVVVSLLVMWSFLRLIVALEKNLLGDDIEKTKADNLRLSARITKVVVITLTAMAISQSLGYSVTPLLTIGGVGGLVVGMAAKDLLANMFGGLMLQIDKPFNTGDWIRVNERGIEGVVEQIGWRITRLRTFTKNPVYVPNSIFSTLPIETPSRMMNRRIKETIGLRYDDIAVVKVITEDITTMLKAHSGIDQNQTLMVNFNEFAVYSVNFFVYVFTNTKDWAEYHQIKQDILFQISDIVAKHGAEFAYPTRVSITQEKKPCEEKATH